MLLREWLSNEFFQCEYPEIKRFFDCELIRYFSHHNATLDWKPWPGKHKHVLNWCIVQHNNYYYGIGFNENPSRGWSFPVKRLTSKAGNILIL